MQTITMLTFRKKAADVLRRVGQGQTVTLTYRGRPSVRLEPVRRPLAAKRGAVDSFYTLDRLATGSGASLTNEQMDELIYGG